MTGFTAIIYKNESARKDLSRVFAQRFVHEEKMICKKYSGKNFEIQQLTNSKFSNDKIFQEDSDYFIGIDGVLLNLNEIGEEKDTFSLLKNAYQKHGDDFLKQLRGDFSGFVYNKKANKWLIFTNQTGSKRIFYFENGNFLLFASDLSSIAKLMKELNLTRNLQLDAAYSLLTNGFMGNEITFIEGVKRLMPGNSMTLLQNKLSQKNYFHLKNIQKNADSNQRTIATIDELFRQAIKREFEKDKAYKYKHIATLSGGLDSRMTVLMAHKMGYTEQLNFTFSQANYLDEQIAKQIAIDHHHEFLFQALDGGNYLRPIDEIVSYNDGLILYSGAAHVLKSCQNINFDSYGLVHTGLIGDAVLGSFLSKPYVVQPALSASMYSSKLLPKVKKYILSVQQAFDSEELYKFYGRAFMGAMNGNYYIDSFSQSVSPFLDIDFLSYCYSIPENMKFKQKIYIDWIALKNKEFAAYPWEKTGVSPLKSLNNKKFFDLAYYQRMRLKLVDKVSGTMKSGMNPFDNWLATNKFLANELTAYFYKNITSVEIDELRHDCTELFEKGNWGERFQVITLLAAIKLHFS
ncbi:MAG: hypothetical protein AUK44_02440 [Porphyromonadaceae bacterium CG2_30_38_12]|nr:MAG: hypothetical protein AUK44_02440 [Porphyromonadaceae bacterium CG2_30_38_12]